MLKIRPIVGDLSLSLQAVHEINNTFLAVIEWLQARGLCHSELRYVDVKNINFVKHGHAHDEEWGKGYLVYLEGLPVAMIDQDIPNLSEQREVLE